MDLTVRDGDSVVEPASQRNQPKFERSESCQTNIASSPDHRLLVVFGRVLRICERELTLWFWFVGMEWRRYPFISISTCYPSSTGRERNRIHTALCNVTHSSHTGHSVHCQMDEGVPDWRLNVTLRRRSVLGCTA